MSAAALRSRDMTRSQCPLGVHRWSISIGDDLQGAARVTRRQRLQPRHHALLFRGLLDPDVDLPGG